MPKAKYPLVEVLWHDAWSQGGWQTTDPQKNEPAPCLSVGYMIAKTKSGVTLAGSLDDGANVGVIQFRPSGMIKSIKVLRR